MTDGSKIQSGNDKPVRPTDTEEIKKELDMLVKEKLDKLSEKVDASRFEDELKEKAERLESEKRSHYRRKFGRIPGSRDKNAPSVADLEHVRVYAASAALHKAENRRIYGEGAIHRTWRLVRTLLRERKSMSGKFWYTEERKHQRYMEIVGDCWSPAANAWDDFWNNAWNFVSSAAEDLWDLLLMGADLIIAAAYYAGSLIYYIWDILWDVRYWVEERKKTIFTAFAMSVVVAALSVLLITSMTFYEYSYHGKVLGLVKSRDDVYRAIEVLGDKLSEATGVTVSLDVERDMEFRKVLSAGRQADSDDDILNIITYMKDLQVEAYVITINGQESVIMESEFEARKLLTSIQDEYTAAAEGVEYTAISYDQSISIRPKVCLLGDIWNESDAKEYLTGNEEKNMPSRITIRSTETATYMSPVPYDTQYIENASIYAGVTEVMSSGIPGTDRVVATIERVNGEEVSRTIVSTTRVSDPVTEVMYMGTKPIPAKKGTGTFKIPLTYYTLSSPFGMRWGRLHTGVDLAAPMSSKIYAADGGTVTYSGWKGTYGYMVIIDHGGLFETYYAHCSKLLVSAGDMVYQGQNIALVGSTGNSSGPHVHFEIRYNGEPKDPMSYL